MDLEDSSSDRPPSKRHSRRESPVSNAGERGHRSEYSEGSSSRRSRSRKSHERRSEESKKHTPKRHVKPPSDQRHGGTISRKTEHSRHQRKKSRSNVNTDEILETPVIRALREVADDISDTPQPSLCGAHQFSFHGNEDNHYTAQRESNCVYVEHNSGFLPVPRHHALGEHSLKHEERWFDLSTASALDIAITIQKAWLPLSNFSHGLLAGVALMQVIVVDKMLGSSLEEVMYFISFYSNFSLIFTSIFFLLASICLVSVFDRLDLARGDWPLLMDLFSIRPRVPWMLIPVYFVGLALALAAARGDDMIHLSQYRNANYTIVKADLDLLKSWHVLNSLRCVCVVAGWLLICATNPPDLLLNLLASMLSHQSANAKHEPRTSLQTSTC